MEVVFPFDVIIKQSLDSHNHSVRREAGTQKAVRSSTCACVCVSVHEQTGVRFVRGACVCVWGKTGAVPTWWAAKGLIIVHQLNRTASHTGMCGCTYPWGEVHCCTSLCTIVCNSASCGFVFISSFSFQSQKTFKVQSRHSHTHWAYFSVHAVTVRCFMFIHIRVTHKEVIFRWQYHCSKVNFF